MPDAIEKDAIPLGQALVPVINRMAIAHSLNGLTESPIETILGAEILTRAGELPHIKFEPQYVWRRFRIDWAALSLEGKPLLFIECDGQAWHSSDEQIARDKARDAECLEAGINVLRFTGRDIDRNWQFCVELIVKELQAAECR